MHNVHWVFSLLLSAVFFHPASASDPKTAAKILADKGLRKNGAKFVLPAESELGKELRKAPRSKKGYMDASKVKTRFEMKHKAIDSEITGLTQQRKMIDQQLPKLLQIDVSRYNQAVTTINQMTTRISELYETKYDSKEAREVSNQVSSAREAYVQFVLDMQSLVDSVTEKYQALAKDAEIEEALSVLGKAEGRTFSLGPSSSFASNVRRLERYLKSVKSERIDLREEANIFWVAVVFNGETTEELVLDTGASSISLPAKLAEKIGLKPSDSDPTVRVSLADGSVITAKAMTVERVRVGLFEVEDVPCIVLPADMTNAPALLGGSFLNHFTYKIDAQATTLTLSRIEDGSGSRSRSSR